MFCPQCGGSNEDTARFCTLCGLDIEEYRRKWQTAGPDTGAGTAPGAAAGYQPNYQQAQYGGPPSGPGYAPPVYQQGYQQGYQQPAPYAPPGYQQGYQPVYQAMPQVASYLVWSILCFVFTFWPTGIAAIIFSAQVSDKLSRGDYAGAVHSSSQAKKWCWISLWIAVALWVLIIIFWVAAIGCVASSGGYNTY